MSNITLKKYHTDESGKRTLITKLETSHLENIIKYIDRKAASGLIKYYCGCESGDAMDVWYDEEIIYGDDVRYEMDYEAYVSELKRRSSV